jgi:hypothetical protein
MSSKEKMRGVSACGRGLVTGGGVLCHKVRAGIGCGKRTKAVVKSNSTMNNKGTRRRRRRRKTETMKKNMGLARVHDSGGAAAAGEATMLTAAVAVAAGDKRAFLPSRRYGDAFFDPREAALILTLRRGPWIIFLRIPRRHSVGYSHLMSRLVHWLREKKRCQPTSFVRVVMHDAGRK